MACSLDLDRAFQNAESNFDVSVGAKGDILETSACTQNEVSRSVTIVTAQQQRSLMSKTVKSFVVGVTTNGLTILELRDAVKT